MEALGLLLVAPHPPGGTVGCPHVGIKKAAFVAALFEQLCCCLSGAWAVAGVVFRWGIFTSSPRSVTCYFFVIHVEGSTPSCSQRGNAVKLAPNWFKFLHEVFAEGPSVAGVRGQLPVTPGSCELAELPPGPRHRPSSPVHGEVLTQMSPPLSQRGLGLLWPRFWGCLFHLSASRASCSKSMGGFPCVRVVAGSDTYIFLEDQGCSSCTEALSSRLRSHDIKLHSLSDLSPPQQHQTTVPCMKWHNITDNNICCIRKVSAASKPRNGVLVDVRLGEPIRPPAFPPAQCQLPRQKGGGTATAIHFVALQGELKAKAGERQPGSLLLKRLSSKETEGELRKTSAETAQMLELKPQAMVQSFAR